MSSPASPTQPLGASIAAGTARIILFGELLADIFPDRETIGGAPFNVAKHLRSFGLYPLLVSRIGRDALGERVQELMNRSGMDAKGLQVDPGHPTGRVLVRLAGPGHTFEIPKNQAYDFIDSGSAEHIAADHPPDLIYFGTLAQRHPVSRNALRILLKTVDAARLLDLNLRAPWYDAAIVRDSLNAADLLKLNEDELTRLAELLRMPGGDTGQRARALLERFELRTILITRGPDGAYLLNADGTETEVPGNANTAIVDTVGAGDAFCAVFILGLLSQWLAATILERAETFARAICGIRGAVPVDENFYVPYSDWA